MVNIAIDGPSGSGKSTLAKALAKKFGFSYVDTGAMYRTIGLYILRTGTDPHDEEAVKARLSEIKMDIEFSGGVQHMFLCGEDVTGLIRTSEVADYASATSKMGAVRAFLLDVQRDMAKKNNVIMDGRDIGTVILPDADVKFFMTASDDARAVRRQAELEEKGEQMAVEEVKKALSARDEQDRTRDIAPAIPADDAIMLDNSGSFEDTLNRAIEIIESRIK